MTTFPRTGDGPSGSTRRRKKPGSMVAVSAALGAVLASASGLSLAPSARADTPPTPTIAAIIPVGAGPADLKLNPAGTRAYVSSTGSSTLSVIDTATKAVVATIPTSPSPRSIAVNRAGTRVYVESEDPNHDGTVTVIDATTNTAAGTFKVGPYPGTMATSKDGKTLYIGHLFGMSIVDTSTNTVTADIDLPGVPRDALMNEAGTRLYASMVNGNSGNVLVIDTSTNSLTADIALTGAPGNIALDPSGTRLYVGGGVWNGFAIIDTATNTVARTVQYATLGANSDKIALDSSGKHLYTWTGGFDLRERHTITSIQDVDPATGKSNLPGNLAELTVMTGMAGNIVASPDGSALYAPGTDYNTVTVIALPPAASGFADIGPNSPFTKEIQWLTTKGITTGWTEPNGTKTFRPLGSVNRDAMAAFMYRMAGSPPFTAPAQSPFTDVATTNQFYKEITWLANQGISTGWTEPDGSKTYRPLEPVNRDAMAAFLYRFAHTPAFTPTTTFTDISPDNPFKTEISWLASTGISTGWDEGNGIKTFRPLQPVARNAMAAFMYRFNTTYPGS
ncbi:S-layer homology domain-containing protein [Arthrobacter sp. NPDC080031]|uniref:S-layer homology domain-containing protein n=1 Tax=Arthrobacter sp. NPDC080031 TaxID=3155918 RepID=UPI00344FB258